ncbi:MAG: D-tagatose 3-epimerase [Armatimonadetes bacterium CG_4_10_14_3_um_filter_66_18]|nr:sugar phosphate isomerase/epimerase [Armatimonadota bacterium]OIP09809.1 MAG: D-tagatose 3-epimerase [Armatimonadetes bacterium CG2_30_66_41]PIU93410.1 MAG: D-tagatose 3-epimerase [Armatimonadetes bacterium CG06_land_8_20_14_3_00_66_21]PIX44672.1 MAG: D-tagatose 3-epimerase [Armatimonadetes bacterium CG_4_8_14_3_um_filter_66_20]PIY51992.1 MAG: D-tagatose 3-epimerase [Armatimonadetes bacterium CG_4_10_14_3_um_filter_66_18]PIZ40437.1 MAG: D-tagatose 3-epimerase [Armatimonadetes bacterium CG_4
MRYAFCNEMFQGWNVKDVFQCAKDEGYEGVEVAPFTLADSVNDLSAERRREIAAQATEVGVEIIGLHWLLVKPEGLYVNHPDDELRQRTRDYFADMIHCCADLGGSVMVIGSPKQRNVLPGQTFRDTWCRTVDVLRSLVDVAAERAVTLCLEPLAGTETNFLRTSYEARHMVEEIDHPNLRLHLDVKAMSSEGRPVEDVIRENADVAGHFHANDANLRGPGFGDVDFVPIFQALTECGYSGWVSVEVFDFKPDPVTIARASMQYMKKCEQAL